MATSRTSPERVALMMVAAAFVVSAGLAPAVTAAAVHTQPWHSAAFVAVLAPTIALGGVIAGVALTFAITGQ